MEFNALLAKISSNYGNINSARAALSRAIRDMAAIGLVQKQDKKIFATDKGLALLGSEMKTKLILKLNDLVGSDNAPDNIDSIVQLLSTLTERAKQDTDLLKAARGSTGFFLSDLQRIRERLNAKAKHLNYLDDVLLQQMDSLRHLNFNDALALPWSDSSKNILRNIVEKIPASEITVECHNKDFLEKARQFFANQKTQEKGLLLHKEEALALLTLAEESFSVPSNTINIYAGSIKIQLNHPNIFFIGPVQELEEIKKMQL